MVHTMVKAPPGEGPVYMVAPVDDLTKVKRVHRNLLKAIVGIAPFGSLAASLQIEPEDSSDDDLLALVRVPFSRPVGQVAREVQTTPALAPLATVTVTLPSLYSAPLVTESSETAVQCNVRWLLPMGWYPYSPFIFHL